MHDTVSAVLMKPPREIGDPRRWRRERTVVDRETGEVKRTLMESAGGLLLTLHSGGALQAERSLPKVYRGENITDLCGPAVSVAVAMLDDEIGRAMGYGLPSFWEWLPVRADYPRSVQLGDEGAVLRTLDKYAEIELPYKGLPVVGQSHSVTWSKGAIHVKAYSKFQETKGDPRALGVLRVEPGVFRTRSFRHLLGLASDAEVRVSDVLTPEVFRKVHDRFDRPLRGGAMTAIEISDREMCAELVRFFGVRRAVGLLGWAMLFAVSGVESRADMISADVGNWRSRYRVVADYRRFRDHLEGMGYQLSDEGDEAADVEQIAERLVRAGMAA